MLSTHLLVLVPCIVLLVTHLRKKRSEHAPLPPGPSPIPVLGNISGIDIRRPWETYTRWGKEYGEIIYTRLLTQDIIVINSEKVAQDLLGKRSQIYSGRPTCVVSLNDIFGVGFSSVMMQYSDRWRLHRRIFHQAFNLSAALSFRPIQMRKAHDMLVRVASNPLDILEHFHFFGTATILSIVYGYDPLDINDPIITNAEFAVEITGKYLRPELAAIIAALPFLMYVPEWFPGAGFKRAARLSRGTIEQCVEVPFERVKKNMAAGIAAPSMVSEALNRIRDEVHTNEELAHLERAVKEACASSFGAASETTSSTLTIFLLAIVLNPDVQTKAQAEIDSVIGDGLPRFPDWGDRPALPYVEAVIKETLRWHPVTPLGIPHATVDDDVYEGYYIPKGATVIANAWAMSRDPIKYPDPEKFKPERFLYENSPSVDELSIAFGFGRRVCAGKYIGDASLWISIASLLAVFRFEASPSWDSGLDGVNVKWTEGLTSRPKDIPCVIKPRHEHLDRERLAYLVGLAGL